MMKVDGTTNNETVHDSRKKGARKKKLGCRLAVFTCSIILSLSILRQIVHFINNDEAAVLLLTFVEEEAIIMSSAESTSKEIVVVPVKHTEEKVLEMIADKESTGRLIDKVLSQNITLPHPYINMGMPKIGSKTLHEFFECSGIDSFHYTCKPTGLMVDNDNIPYNVRNHYCGNCMTTAVKHGLPPIESCGYGNANNGTGLIGIDTRSRRRRKGKLMYAAKAFTQLDHFDKRTRNCVMPQISMLEEIHNEHPQATFIWISRPFHDWNTSLTNYHAHSNGDSLYDQFMKCNLPGLPSSSSSGTTTTTNNGSDDLLRWVVNAQQTLRDFVQKYPSHALIELDLYDPNNDNIMTKLLFGLQQQQKSSTTKKKGCWGHANDSYNIMKSKKKKRNNKKEPKKNKKKIESTKTRREEVIKNS